MAQKDTRVIQAELAKPFAAEDLEWRLQRTFESKGRTLGIAVPYVTNRAIMNRLDAVVGPENWYNEFKPWHNSGKKEAQICGISIYFEGKGFITKWDGAEDSDIEPIKGGLSDSMKRAAVQWGIGRVLYNMDTVLVDVEQRGKSWVIQKSARAKLDKTYLDMLKALKLEPAPAGGVQCMLTPQSGDSAEGAPPPPQRTGTPAIPNRNAASTSKGQQAPAGQAEQTPEPEYEFIISAAKIQKDVKTASTIVKLKSLDGKELTAFAQGEHPLLAPGTMLTETKLAVRKQGNVVYYILESYQIIPPDQRAA